MTIREREPRIILFGFPIGSKIGKELKPGGWQTSVEGPENEDGLEGPWRGYYRGYYVEVIDSDTLAKGRIVNQVYKKENGIPYIRTVLLPMRQILRRDEINQDPITRKIVYWEP